jgi:hypothetical protein
MTAKPKTDLAQPITEPPALLKTVVSVKATIPTQPYGNIEVFVSQEMYMDASNSQDVRAGLIISEMESLKRNIAEMVLPLAEAEVERAQSALVKAPNPDVWMQQANPLYRWLRVAEPDLNIPAMDAILTKRLPVND